MRHDDHMALQLAPEEPEARPWRVEPLTALVQSLTQRGSGGAVSGRPVILAVDGRSDNGKTTLALRIGAAVPRAAVLHTDDIAWEYARFDWAGRLADEILVPLRRGEAVSYRPPPWAEHGRDGSLDVPAGCPLVVVEGDGAGRRELAPMLDAVIWVQCDLQVAEQRRIARTRDPDALEAANLPLNGPPDHAGWLAEEIPFNTAQRTWERADIIVCGSPEIPCDPATDVVVAPPVRRAAATAATA
jgi:hypothetical protein